MNSEDYIQGAIRTESGRFDSNNVDSDTIEAVLGLVVAAGQALDTLKRGLYYGKPVNQEKLNNAIMSAEQCISQYHNPHGANLEGYSSVPAVSPRIVHAAMGLGTESAEILEKVLDSFKEGSDFDFANLFEELSDTFWYSALAVDAARNEDPDSFEHAHPQLPFDEAEEVGFRRWKFETIWEKNIAKLKARYPDKFTTNNAYNRDHEKEKAALGQKTTKE